MPDKDFLDFVVQLVKLGGLGIGALIFVMAFIILLRNQTADAGMAKFRISFLQWGFGFAVLALAATVLDHWIPRPGGKVNLGVTVSPNFGDAKLPQPQMTLMPSGTPVSPDGHVLVSGDSTLNIEVRGIVQGVKDLTASSNQLLDTNKTLTEALDKSSAAVAAAQQQQQAQQGTAAQPATVLATAVPTVSKEDLASIKASQQTVAKSLATGNFSNAAQSTKQLHILMVKPGFFGSHGQ